MYTEDVIKKIHEEYEKIDDEDLFEVLNSFIFRSSRKATLSLVKYCMATEAMLKTYTIDFISKASNRKNDSSIRSLLHRLGNYGVVKVLREKPLRYCLSEEFKKAYREKAHPERIGEMEAELTRNNSPLY